MPLSLSTDEEEKDEDEEETTSNIVNNANNNSDFCPSSMDLIVDQDVCKTEGLECRYDYVVMGCRKSSPICDDSGAEDAIDGCERSAIRCVPAAECYCEGGIWMCLYNAPIMCDETPQPGDGNYISDLYEDLPSQGTACHPSNFSY